MKEERKRKNEVKLKREREREREKREIMAKTTFITRQFFLSLV